MSCGCESVLIVEYSNSKRIILLRSLRERKEAQGLLNINNTWRPSCLLVRRDPCATETDLKVHEGETKITKNLGHLLRSGASLRVRRLRTRGPTQMEDGGGTMDDGP